MMLLARLLATWSAIGYLSIASPAAAADHSGAQLAMTCAACHRLDKHAPGDRTTGIPPITGLEAETLAGLMRAFRQNAYTNHIMHTISLQLSDEEIAAVASYLADLGKADQP
jgi:cytochrome c553